MPVLELHLIAPSSTLFADGTLLILRDKKGRDKTIPISSIQSINLFPPKTFTRGELRLSIPKPPTGAIGFGRAAISVGNEEERYVYLPEEHESAVQIYAHIRSVMASKGGTSTPSLADELTKLKALLDSGTLTQEEFDAAKKKLLE